MTNFADLDHVDLGPAAERLAQLVASTPGDLLDASTPCPAYAVGDLVDHVGGLAIAFTDAAKKTPPAGGSPGASGDASRPPHGLPREWACPRPRSRRIFPRR